MFVNICIQHVGNSFMQGLHISPKHILLLYYNQRLLKFLSFISSKILQFSWLKKWFLHVKFLKLNFTAHGKPNTYFRSL